MPINTQNLPKFVQYFKTSDIARFFRSGSETDYDALVKAIYDSQYKMYISYPEVDESIIVKLSTEELDKYIAFYDKIWNEYQLNHPNDIDDIDLWHDYLHDAFMDVDFFITGYANGYEREAHVDYIDLENPIWT